MSVITIPRKLPLFVVPEVLLPGSTLRISVTRSGDIELVKNRILSQSTLSSTIIGILPRSPAEPQDSIQLNSVGTAAVVVQVAGTTWPKPAFTLLVTGLCRFRLEKLIMEVPYPVGMVTQLDKLSIDDDDDENPELTTLLESFRGETQKMLDVLDISLPSAEKLKKVLNSVPANQLADICASLVNVSFSEKRQILESVNLMERVKKILPILTRHIEELETVQKHPQNLKKSVNTVPHYHIRNQYPKTSFKKISNLKKDDDDDDYEDEEDDLHELHKKLRAAKLPTHARKVAFKEFQKLKRMTPHSPEIGIIRNYVELLAELPWSKSSSETLDVNKARKDLDIDHYAMDKLKRRVLEYLAVRQLKNNLRGPILCFVGPPGVGKTSVGRSIAQTLGREFHRISLGGVNNQSDIRGHRRTYIGSMPGRIIQGLKQVGTNNPVFLLDEIDKLGSSIHAGDPAAALLEVLDPEQNNSFTDHYVNVPFDLSQVMFIATANSTKTIPPALLDRMELIYVPGYTQEEKLHIAIKHLLPKQLEEHGLSNADLQLPESSVKLIICSYTHEAGVRTLERKLSAICRAVAVKVAEMQQESRKKSAKLPIIITEEITEEILGPAVYSNSELWSRLGQPGVAVGLAFTEIGGEVLLVEASKMEGDGEVVLTGQLGNVMKESATLSLNWVRTAAAHYGLRLDGEMLSQTDIHIHFPAGAVEKEGPSAGVTIVTALMSLFSNRPVSVDVAMTGEITLRGSVLPVGGIKEKVLAAHRAGFTRVILPQLCEKDLHEIPESVKNNINFIFVTHVDEVLQAAFDGGFPCSPSSDVDTLISKL